MHPEGVADGVEEAVPDLEDGVGFEGAGHGGYPVGAEEGVAMGVDWGGVAFVDAHLAKIDVFAA